MGAMEGDTNASRLSEGKIERAIGWREIIRPFGVALIPFSVLVISSLTQSKGPGQPIIYSVLLITLVTFACRGIWLARRCKTHLLVASAKTFAPERFSYLGLVIAVVMVLVARMTGQLEVTTSSPMAQWVAGLLTTVPLLEVFGNNWGQLQARRILKGSDRDLEEPDGGKQLPGGPKNLDVLSSRIETWMG